MSEVPMDWKIFTGSNPPHDGLMQLPPPPPWRFANRSKPLSMPVDLELDREKERAEPFLPSPEMILAVNASLYLRRPLLITGKPGTGKSTLISSVAHELKLGPVIRWPISSRSTVRGGVYEYDAVGRLQAGDQAPPVEQYLTLSQLGTALVAQTWPRPLLIDEIDKSDLDFANDLLNVIEEGTYEIAEIRRLNRPVDIKDYFRTSVKIGADGIIDCGQFPFVVMTSNDEREFPAPFLRRCIQLNIEAPDSERLSSIIESHLGYFRAEMGGDNFDHEVQKLISDFNERISLGRDIATDQLLNAVFLTATLKGAKKRTFNDEELAALRESLLRQIGGSLG